jgi:hypothetical protein
MTLHDALVVVHVVAGGAGLVLAWPTLYARKRRGMHTVLGRIFAGAAAGVCGTTFVLFAMNPGELFGLGILGLLTAVWTGGGVWLARTKPRVPGGWMRWHLQLMGSAVIAFVTAFLVQMTDGSLVAWIGPTIVGSPLIGRRSAQLAAPRRRTAPAG